jgi:hypothetical protein
MFSANQPEQKGTPDGAPAGINVANAIINRRVSPKKLL